ncbi:MAG: glycosyltransferase family protein [Bacteroidota bacterium]
MTYRPAPSPLTGDRTLRVLFIVQGEGRGHMTQALAVRQMLTAYGHSVTHTLVGRSARRQVPAFFAEGIATPITCFDSPNFVTGKGDATVRMWPTAWYNATRLGSYARSLKTIDGVVKAEQPDVIVSFYEGLTGLYTKRYRPAAPVVTVGHQFLFLHPSYPFGAGNAAQRRGAQLYTRFTSMGAAARIGLSLYRARDLPSEGIAVVPPILRDEVFDLLHTRRRDVHEAEDFLLVYLLEAAMGEELMAWSDRNPDVKLHCFWDRFDQPDAWAYNNALTFHHLSGTKFLEKMARCRGVVCTAGFESVSEAMLLGKPLFMVPVRGHIEQQWNALDAVEQGAGITAPSLDLDRFMDYLPTHATDPQPFRDWVAQAERRVISVIEGVAGLDPLVPAGDGAADWTQRAGRGQVATA